MSHPSAPPPPPGSERFVSPFVFFRVIDDERDWRATTGWWCRTATEQQTVRTAPVAAAHHSAQQNDAPRGPKTATRAREEAGLESHSGLRAPTPLPPGERPGLLQEPGPQRSDRTVRSSSGDAPSLAMPVQAATSDEAIDSATLLPCAARSGAECEESMLARSTPGSRLARR